MKVKATVTKNNQKARAIQKAKEVKKWHLYAARKGPYYIYPLDILKQGIAQSFHISVQPDIFCKDGYAEVRYSKREMDRFGKLIFGKILKKPKFTEEMFAYAKKEAPELWRCGEKLLTAKLNDKRGTLTKLSRFHQTYINFAFHSQITWFWGRKFLFDYLKKYLAKKAKKESINEYLIILTSPLKPSFDFEQRRSLVKIAQKKFKKMDITKDLKEHTENFEWITFDYNGPKIYTEKDFLKNIDDLLKSDLKEEIRKINNYFIDLRKKQNKLFNKLKIDKNHRRLFYDMQAMTLQQDFKKEATTKAHLSVYRFLKRLTKQRKVEFKALFYLTLQELENFVLNNEFDKAEINKRKKFCVAITTPHSTEVFTGKIARDLAKIIRSRDEDKDKLKQKNKYIINGQTASKGKVKGLVKVIIDPEDVSKMKKRAVLVTKMTTPAFMPIMKKSSAIITDEGGITCHAAIVSRELGIPCVIGTKIATKLLKDGDVVEVDANKGVVRVLKEGRKNR